VAGDDGKFVTAAAADFIAVPVALSLRQIHKTGRRKFVQIDAVAVGSDVGPFGLRDLIQIHADAGEADGLGGRGARIGGGHFFHIKKIDAANHGRRDEDQGKSSHGESVNRRAEADKCSGIAECARKQQARRDF
jgi:hypothetical protein